MTKQESFLVTSDKCSSFMHMFAYLFEIFVYFLHVNFEFQVMFKSRSKLNLRTIWLLHWLLLKQLLTIISAKWFSLYYSITIRFFKLWAYKMWRLYYSLTFKFSYYSPLAKSMLETYCVWELLSFVDHASTKICRKKPQKFLRNQENVGCISYDFVTTSEKKPFSPLI